MAMVGSYHYPYLPVRLALRDRFDAASVIGRVPCAILFVHAGEDEIMPLAAGRALFLKAREPKEFVVVPGARHNDLLGSLTRYADAIRRFLEPESPTGGA